MYESHTQNQKYLNYIQPLNQHVFGIIHHRLSSIDPLWYEKKILDYGCNVGHLLTTAPANTIDPTNYIGIDPQYKALDVARENHPDANWIHYDGYHVAFNPNGSKTEKPNLPFNPEIIVSHGVFTHCDMETILETLEYFKQIIQPNGYIVFSVWEDKHYHYYIDKLLKERFGLAVPESIRSAEYNNSCYLINRNEITVDKEHLDIESCDWLETFYTRSYLLSTIPGIVDLPGPQTKHTIFILPT